MTYSDRIAATLTLKPTQVAAAVQLFDEGNTIPFVARYRKEATRNLDEEQLRQISELMEKLRALDERRERVQADIKQRRREERKRQVAQKRRAFWGKHR